MSILTLIHSWLGVEITHKMMSNKQGKIDLTKWSGVTFLNNFQKMDVFLVNGASMAMNSRPPIINGKQAVFQKPSIKPRPKLKQPNLMNKKLSPEVRSLNKKKETEIKVGQPRSGNLHVKLPSVESDDYRSTSPSETSGSSSSEDEDEEQEGKKLNHAGNHILDCLQI